MHDVALDGNEAVQAALELEHGNGADRGVEGVGARGVACVQGMPQWHDAVEELDAGDGAGDAAAETVDEQDAAAALENPGLAAGGIAEG